MKNPNEVIIFIILLVLVYINFSYGVTFRNKLLMDLIETKINSNYFYKYCPFCNITATVTPTSTHEEDVIMTVVTRYKPSVGYLIRSIRSVGCKATIVLFVSDTVEIPSEILKCGVELIRIPLTNRVSTSIAKLRWELYYNYLLNDGKKFKRVMHTDGFDAFYFGDPFSVASDENTLYFQNEERIIETCTWNNWWLQECHFNVSKEILNSPIICSGSLIGGRIPFLKMIELMITHEEWTQCWEHGFDQGDFNYIIYTRLNQSYIKHEFIGCNGKFISMHNCWPKGKHLGPSGYFQTVDDKDTLVYLHQYNRHKNIVDYIKEKCSPSI